MASFEARKGLVEQVKSPAECTTKIDQKSPCPFRRNTVQYIVNDDAGSAGIETGPENTAYKLVSEDPLIQAPRSQA